MSFNLIHENWIPVRREDGARVLIAPWQITEKLNPVTALDAPRADFNGALIQFLIGLVQTTMAPKDDRAWRTGLTQPPEPDRLREAFELVSSAFDLDGAGARFMQEQELKNGKQHPASYLLIDAPTDNTRDENRDHFVKRDLFQRSDSPLGMCPACVSAAIFTLQLFSPQGGGGGGGKFVGLRGGGPITTLITGGKLWETVWLNVLRLGDIQDLGNATGLSNQFDQRIFPWLKPDVLVEEKTGKSVYLVDVHPLHMYWAMPRRLLLRWEATSADCMLCGKDAQSLVFHYHDAASGIHYKPPWRHPLSPHYQNKNGVLLPQHGRPDGVSYRHWLGWVLADTSSGEEPARIVHEFSRRQQWSELHKALKSGARVWAFGYDLAKMNARGWSEGIMPLIEISESDQAAYEENVARLIRVADWTKDNLLIALKRVWQAKPKVNGWRIEWKFTDIKSLPKDEAKARDRILTTVGRSRTFQGTSSRFWQDTEADFYTTLKHVRDALAEKLDLASIKLRWLARLAKEAESIFDELAQATMSGAADPKRIVLALREMRYANSESNVSVRKLLDLPIS